MCIRRLSLSSRLPDLLSLNVVAVDPSSSTSPQPDPETPIPDKATVVANAMATLTKKGGVWGSEDTEWCKQRLFCMFI